MSAVYLESNNIISALGHTTQDNIEAILSNKSGIKKIINTELSSNELPLSLIDDSILASDLAPLKEAGYSRFEGLIIASITETIKSSAIDIKSDRTVFILSTTKGNIELLSQGNTDVSLSGSSQKIMDHFEMKGKPYIISNACISGVMALIVAKRMINQGHYDNAVVVGADVLTKFIVSGFESFSSLSPNRCKPFDAQRDGLNLGEGIATQIVSKQYSQGNIALIDGSISNDANHISGPSRTGEGLKVAIDKIIGDDKNIDMISCHGTSTPYNDAMEGQAIVRTGLEKATIVGTKGYTGHTLGAAGVIETIISTEALKRNTIPCTLGYDEHGVEANINVSKSTQKIEMHKLLKVASGFGGCNAAALFSKDSIEATQEITKTTNEKIIGSIEIENGKIILDGELAFQHEDTTFDVFSKAAYKNLEIAYAKFYKMDRLSKLGILAAEYLLNKVDISNYDEKEIAIIFANASASLNSDIKYQESIASIPSPAYFVYTLPNIVIGEIAIKHRIKGEGIFFIQKEYNPTQLQNYRRAMCDSTSTSLVLEGWLEVDAEGNYCSKINLINLN